MVTEDIQRKYKQLYKDISYIESNYGAVYDQCGGWCNCDVLKDLLKNPTYENAYKHLFTKLNRLYDLGVEDRLGYDIIKLPINEDIKLQRIKKKWLDNEN